MSRRRTALAPIALLTALSLGLTACGGDDDEKSGDKGDKGSSSSSDGGNPPPWAEDGEGRPEAPATDAKCTVDVSITGDAEEAWDGNGSVRFTPAGGESSGSSAVYLTERGKRSLRIYSVGPEFKNPAATVVIQKKAYASNPDDPAGIVAQKNAKKATIDATLTAIDEATVQVRATFDCEGKPKPKKDKKDEGDKKDAKRD